jgi:hypothetical protein
MTTRWYVPHSPKSLWLTYKLIRRTRGPVRSLIALWKYWRAPLPF